MEQGVMMHQQHQPWVVPPAEVADGTHDWRGATYSHTHTHTLKNACMQITHAKFLFAVNAPQHVHYKNMDCARSGLHA